MQLGRGCSAFRPFFVFACRLAYCRCARLSAEGSLGVSVGCAAPWGIRGLCYAHPRLRKERPPGASECMRDSASRLMAKPLSTATLDRIVFPPTAASRLSFEKPRGCSTSCTFGLRRAAGTAIALMRNRRRDRAEHPYHPRNAGHPASMPQPHRARYQGHSIIEIREVTP